MYGIIQLQDAIGDLEKMESPSQSTEEFEMQFLGVISKTTVISICFQGKPFNITVIQVYVQSSNAEEAEVEWFYEDLQDLLELTTTKDVLFIRELGTTQRLN